MRAVVYDRYGPPGVLRLADIPRPIPGAHEVLIRVHATTVNRTDCAIRSGEDVITRFGYSIVTTGSPVKGLLRPTQRVLGTEFAGEIVEVGAAATGFMVGERVFGVNAGRFGAHAEYLCMRATAPLAAVPAGMPYDEAAAICDGGLLALGCLRKVGLQVGQRILIYGSSGAIGTAGVQLAKALGAHVTAVCATKNMELARSLGADQIIDYTRDDFTKNGQTYDVIFDAVGKHVFRRCHSSLTPSGLYIATDGRANGFWAIWTARSRGRRVLLDIPPHYRQRDVLYLKELIEAGKYRAVVDRRYPLQQIADASRYVETQQKVGNVVLTITGDDNGE